MQDDNDLKAKLNLETAKITWQELQRYFSQGIVLNVSNDLDLIDAAVAMSEDNKTVIEQWMVDGRLAKVSDKQASEWFEQDVELWSVVVRPWVLVQDKG